MKCMDSRMPLQPTVFLGLVGIQVVQHNVEITIRMRAHDLIHEVQKLSPPPSAVMAGYDLSGGDVEGREQGGSAVPLVSVAESIQRFSVGQPEPPLRSFQCLNGRLFIHAQDQGVLWRIQIQSHDVGSLRTEFRVRADTPTPPPLQTDVVLAQNTPDLIVAHISESLGQQCARPLPVAFGRRLVQQRQHSSFSRRVIVRGTAFPVSILQAVQSPGAEALPPLRNTGGPSPQLLRDLQVGPSLVRQQYHLGPLSHPLFTCTGARPLPESPFLFRGQTNRCSLAHPQKHNTIRLFLQVGTSYVPKGSVV